MSRRAFSLGVLGIACILGAYSYLALRQPLPAIASMPTALHETATTTAPLSWPSTGEAAIGAVGDGILASHGANTPLPTASVTKIMVALSVLHAKPLQPGQQGPVITITPADVSLYNMYVAEDGSVVKVAVGEQITEYQALEAMLLPSANNIADMLATWAFGSISAYSTYANNLARSLQMTDTTIGDTDASGFSPATTSTPHDLVLLGMAALKNPVISQIVAEPSAVVPVAGTVYNVNWLLGDDGINGIKTGNTNQAGGVFLFSADKDFPSGQKVTIIGAIMGAPSLETALDDSVPLLTSAKANFLLTPLIHSDQIVSQYNVPWEGEVNVTAQSPLSAITWQGTNTPPIIHLDNVHAPLTAHAQVGTVSFPTDNSSVPLVLNQGISSPTWQWRLLHAF